MAELQKPIQETLDSCPEIVESVERLITAMDASYNRVVVTLNSPKYEKVQKEQQIQTVKCLLKNAIVMTSRYVATVNDIFRYCCGDNAIVDALNRKDFTPLLGYLEVLEDRISYAMAAHEEAKNACEKVQSQSVTAAEFCMRKEEDAKTKKRLAMGVGGVVTGATAVVGIGGSVIAGIVTFGIGGAIGAAITAAVVPAVAGTVGTATSGVATGLLAFHYKGLERELKNVSTDFNKAVKISSNILSQLEGLHTFTISFSRNADVVSNSLQSSNASTQVIETVNGLFDVIRKSSEMSSTCLQKMEELKSKVENI